MINELKCEGCCKVSDDLYASIFNNVMICIVCLNIEEKHAQTEAGRMEKENWCFNIFLHRSTPENFLKLNEAELKNEKS